jgi:hypothetical protein
LKLYEDWDIEVVIVSYGVKGIRTPARCGIPTIKGDHAVISSLGRFACSYGIRHEETVLLDTISKVTIVAGCAKGVLVNQHQIVFPILTMILYNML